MRDGAADERGRSNVEAEVAWGRPGVCGGAIPGRAEMKLPDIEMVSAKVHGGLDGGETGGGGILARVRDGRGADAAVRRAAVKELDRATVRAVYAAIRAVGEAPPDDG
jgi:hypothetical protein